MRFYALVTLAVVLVWGCDDCYGPHHDAAHIRRMQPGVPSTQTSPKAPLAWGQLNFLHTTDTHGWLESHLKEQNYGADWGDYVSFVKHMRHKARQLGVDLLLVDTGDLHDGNGLSDATSPDGSLSNPIFEKIDYDLLTIGNHELYLSDIAYLTFNQFSKAYGEKYITSNVQIINPSTRGFEYIGSRYRYFTTYHGLRIMAFGVLYNFNGNSNVSKVIKAADMIKESWFIDAVNIKKPIDLFVLIGHNPVKLTDFSNTLKTVYGAIRAARPVVPIQMFGGHTHMRDFQIYDQGATALESGRYCETLGFVSMSGIKSSSYRGVQNPGGVPNPNMKAIKVATNGTTSSTIKSSATGTAILPSSSANTSSFSNLLYSRRYLDWNRLTFAYHATGSQDKTFDTPSGLQVTNTITNTRQKLNLTALYGCVPETYCVSCKAFGSPGNIFPVIQTALAATVVNPDRAKTPRLIIINSGSIRFDLVQGPFTFDDSFIVSPFNDAFQYIPNVPYAVATKVLPTIQSDGSMKRRDLETRDFGFASSLTSDNCVDAVLHSQSAKLGLSRRTTPLTRDIHRRQSKALTPGYITIDDFGNDGDDTLHSKIPFFAQPTYVAANASFPPDGSVPAAVDLIFFDFFAADIISTLAGLGFKVAVTAATADYYLDSKTFNAQNYLPAYAKLAWQKNVPSCPVSGV